MVKCSGFGQIIVIHYKFNTEMFQLFACPTANLAPNQRLLFKNPWRSISEGARPTEAVAARS